MKVPGRFTDPALDELSVAITRLARGSGNGRGTITLTLSSATTTLTDAAIQVGDYVLLQAVDANAAAETIHCEDGASTAGQVTLTHSNAGTTRKFRYQVSGT